MVLVKSAAVSIEKCTLETLCNVTKCNRQIDYTSPHSPFICITICIYIDIIKKCAITLMAYILLILLTVSYIYLHIK